LAVISDEEAINQVAASSAATRSRGVVTNKNAVGNDSAGILTVRTQAICASAIDIITHSRGTIGQSKSREDSIVG
jgi:hypothetical protein